MLRRVNRATGLAHVATVSFLASRAAPSLQFFFALGGGIALARASLRGGARVGHGVSLASMLQTVAVMGPARINAPLTQAITAPMMGRLQARGARWWVEFLCCLGLRLVHYTVLLAAFIYVILGGIDEFTASYGTLTGWLGIVPQGPEAALLVTAAGQLLWAMAFSGMQVAAYRRALGAWPGDSDGDSAETAGADERRALRGAGSAAADERPGRDSAEAAGADERRALRGAASAAGVDPGARELPPIGAAERASARFDPRAVVLCALVATALLLASTSWALLAAVAVWLVPAWFLSDPDRDAVPLGLALAGLLAFAALTGGLLSGAGLELTLQRVLRAVLLVAVATWMRAAARTGGLREVFRRMLSRLRRIPSVPEAIELLAGLDAGPRLVAAGRAAASRFSDVELRPAELCDTVTAWVAVESASYVPGAAVVPPVLRLRVVDALLVAFSCAPVLALVGS